MGHKFFISHYRGDSAIAELFSNALGRITLGQINPWFSSDAIGGGGLQPGDMWFNQILSKITQSKAVVSLLTPNSINRPWIYFESGIGQALDNCEIIVICIGLNKSDILPPLGLYQCYQLNDYRSVVEFFSKLLTLFEIKFDEEMSKVVIEGIVTEISKITFAQEKKTNENQETIQQLIENFKSHIDKRFLEVLEKNQYSIVGNNLNISIEDFKPQPVQEDIVYSVQFDVDFPGFKNKNLFLDIRSSDSFQTLTNSLYFMISEHVGPFKYLEKWVIVDQRTNRHVIIREIADEIPATSIFKPNSKWTIIKLKTPYCATDSGKRMFGDLSI
ncbi:toll/interleukin-1 receptor domain-containing protein [Mucilaginibacter rubeus]|uniref:Toll/interleukin-1 receptor domain-containing protein n=1 Tax=Mucilaginibacter rubeus TaxID=2027860 RepID=A0A5C1I3M6_9SPHI|nr:toll/interleukin-1 receptor domain-containing protein [Mucilaginibacter rubeus]QEM12822.1 toll/interleukin-1 receptor domain-containing protein [Mucilaginibacter rubeus]